MKRRYLAFQCDALLRIFAWSNDRLYALNSFSALAGASTPWAGDVDEDGEIRTEGELERRIDAGVFSFSDSRQESEQYVAPSVWVPQPRHGLYVHSRPDDILESW